MPRGISSSLTYYVDTAGSDANNGLSPSTPWQTITKVNAATFNPGDQVLFKGGQTFSGSLVASNSGTCSKRITYSSYGTGQATISSTTSNGFTATNKGGITVNNLVFTGGGNLTTTGTGIAFGNTSGVTISCVTISNTTISQYGGWGIFVIEQSGSHGFDTVLISANTIHDVTGGDAVNFTCGIYVANTSPIFGYFNSNITVTGNLVFNTPGVSGTANWSGSSIMLRNTNGAVLSHNTSHDFGSGGTGGGIWAANSNNITIEFNEAYNGGNILSDGFDFDGAVLNSLMQYNYSHDNAGSGINACQYAGAPGAWDNNVYRYNITANNADSEFHICSGDPRITNLQVFNNTFYTATSGRLIHQNPDSFPPTGFFANNIFYKDVSSGLFSIEFGDPGVISFTNNDYVGAINYFWASGTTYANFAAWQTGTGEEKIAGVNVGLTSNPAFVGGGGAAGFKYLGTSPMVGAGLSVNSQYSVAPGPTDYFGTTIPTGHGSGFDVGAFAFP